MQKTIIIDRKNLFYKLILAGVVILVILPFLLKEGIPFGNDASFHLSRIVSLSEGLKNGVFLPGVYSDYFSGMGYGNGLFYPDVFLYIPAVLTAMGLFEITAYKLFLMLVTALTAITMFYSVKTVWESDFAACVSASMLLLCSFHTTDLYLRSSVGEVLAFMFLPLIIAGFHQVVYGDVKKWWMLCVGFTGLVLSHVLTAVITAVFSIIFLLSTFRRLIKEPVRLYTLVKAAIWSFVFSCFFIIPMLEQFLLNPVWGDTGLLGNIVDWAVPLDKLILAVPQNVGALYIPPAGIGLILLLINVSGFFYGKRDQFLIGLSIFGLILLFCSTNLFPWQLFKNTLSTLQFPWRFYLFVSVFWCFAAGKILELLPIKQKRRWILTGITLILMLFSFSINVAYIYKNYAQMLVNTYPAFAAGCEYLPQSINYGDLINLEKETNINAKRTNYNVYEITIEQNASNQLPILYYPGYEATLNGEPITILQGEDGMAKIETKETGVLLLQYKGTLLRRFCEGISLAAGFIGVIIFARKKTSKREKNDR